MLRGRQNEFDNGTNKKKRKSSSKQKSRPKKRPKPESTSGLPLSAAADLLSELTGVARGDFSCPLCGEKYASAKCLRGRYGRVICRSTQIIVPRNSLNNAGSCFVLE